MNQSKIVKTKFILLSIFLSLLTTTFTYGQGATCGEAEPFCADNTGVLVFENSNTQNGGSPSAQPGINYSCPSSGGPNDPGVWRYPAWYYIRIQESGDLVFTISQSPTPGGPSTLDVDFHAWGPFDSPSPDCENDLTPANGIDCSWLPDSTETLTINGATEGEYYMLMITNYSTLPGWITITQTNGGTIDGGSTDCSIVAGNLGQDQQVCMGTEITLDGETEGATQYEWSRDLTPDDGVENFDLIVGEASSTLTITDNITAIYRVTVQNEAGETDSDDVRIEFVANPEAEPGELTVCSDGTTGLYTLTQLDSQISTEQNVAITYHETENEAITGEGDLSSPYSSEPKTIYVRVENVRLGCYATTTAELKISLNPENLTVENEILCEEDGNGIELFDLTTKNTEALGSQNPDSYSVSYHLTMAGATNNVEEIENPTTFENTSNPQTIYIRVENNSNQSCHRVIPFEISVAQNPVTNDVPISIPTCSASLEAVFDLTEVALEVANYNNDMLVSFYEDANLTNLITNPTAYTTETTVVYGSVQDPTTECIGIGEVQLQVIQTPEQRNQSLSQCATNTANNEAIFDLSALTPAIINNAPNVTVTYHTAFNDANASISGGINPINNNSSFSSTTATIYARSEATYNNSFCHTVSEVSLTVLPRPFAQQLNYVLCSETTTASFNLASQIDQITSSTANVAVTFFEDEALQNQITNTNDYASGSKNIYVLVVNTETNCQEVTTLNLQVIENPKLSALVTEIMCLTNEQAVFNLDQIANSLQAQYPNFTFSFFEDEAATIGISSPYTITESTTIFTRFDLNGTNCYSVDEVHLNVLTTPVIQYDDAIICLSQGFTLPNGEIVYEAGSYERIVPDVNGCDILTKINLIVGNIEFPNAFAPNSNGVNDVFRAIPADECVGLVENYHLVIYNRWGQQVFETNEFQQGWDGRHNGVLLDGTYLWHATYTFQEQAFNRKGTVAILH